MYTNAINTLLYPLWCYIFIVKYDMGIKGASLCNLISMLCIYVMNIVYTSF